MTQNWEYFNAYRHQVTLRENLRAELKRQNITRAEIGELLGVTAGHIGQLMRNPQGFNRARVRKIVEFLGVDYNTFVGDSYVPQHSGSRDRIPLPEAKKVSEVVDGKRRALCCECGSMRLVSVGASISRGRDPIFDYYEEDLRGFRMVSTLKCGNCKATTRHALLRDNDDHSDCAEEVDYGPTAEDVAREELQKLARRVADYAPVDFHWRVIGNRKWNSKAGFAPCLGAEYDESKSRWRIEINTQFPAQAQLECLKEIWEVIALDQDDWWHERGLEPTSGVWMTRKAGIEASIEGLVDEIRWKSGAIRRKLALDMTDAADRGAGAAIDSDANTDAEAVSAQVIHEASPREEAEPADLNRALALKFAEHVATEVRAEMARQNKRAADLAELLNVSYQTVLKSLKGTRPFKVAELPVVADWLEVEVGEFFPVPVTDSRTASPEGASA